MSIGSEKYKDLVVQEANTVLKDSFPDYKLEFIEDETLVNEEIICYFRLTLKTEKSIEVTNLETALIKMNDYLYDLCELKDNCISMRGTRETINKYDFKDDITFGLFNFSYKAIPVVKIKDSLTRFVFLNNTFINEEDLSQEELKELYETH